jgi:hypothetical protein
VWKSFFLLDGALLFDEKLCLNGAQVVFPNHPPYIKCMFCTFIRDLFWEKRSVCSHTIQVVL